jgi:hypothetical protein
MGPGLAVAGWRWPSPGGGGGSTPGGPRLGRGLALVDPADGSLRLLDSADALQRPIDVGLAPGDGAAHVVSPGPWSGAECPSRLR